MFENFSAKITSPTVDKPASPMLVTHDVVHAKLRQYHAIARSALFVVPKLAAESYSSFMDCHPHRVHITTLEQTKNQNTFHRTRSNALRWEEQLLASRFYANEASSHASWVLLLDSETINRKKQWSFPIRRSELNEFDHFKFVIGCFQ